MHGLYTANGVAITGEEHEGTGPVTFEHNLLFSDKKVARGAEKECTVKPYTSDFPKVVPEHQIFKSNQAFLIIGCCVSTHQ